LSKLLAAVFLLDSSSWGGVIPWLLQCCIELEDSVGHALSESVFVSLFGS